MKKILLLSIILTAFAAPVQADTVQIQALATDVFNTYGTSFSSSAGGAALTDDTAVEAVIASDETMAIYGSDPTAYSVIDLGFGDNNVLTGSGSDLVVFSLWQGHDYFFALQAFGTDSSVDPLSSFNYAVTGDSIFQQCAIKDGSGECLADVSATSIDLFGSDLFALDDDVEIAFIRLFVGGSFYNGSTGGLDAYSNFTLVGANYTDAMVVPLPLPIVLFSSGLAFLGLIARRKKV